jgi:hypothetical protein
MNRAFFPTMAICKTCGAKYSKWTTPVSAGGLCDDCFTTVLNSEREVKPEEQQSSAATLPSERRNVRIRFTSFIPRSRSKTVFALAMSCYCVTLSYFIGTWARALRIKPPAAFYLSGGIADVIGLLVFAPIFESLILSAVFELVRWTHAPQTVQVIAAALFVSEAHAWSRGDRFSFLLHSGCFLPLLASQFTKTAFGLLVSIHALNNSIAAVSVIGRAMWHG